MKMERIAKEGFVVIGREGSTEEGAGFIQRLWAAANANFGEIAHLAILSEAGVPVGIWGAMSDFSRSFASWQEGFSKGLYLAGAECRGDAQPPEGWTRWAVPGYEYLRVENDAPECFGEMIAYMEAENIPLAGAVHDFTDPAAGKGYMLFPIRRLEAWI